MTVVPDPTKVRWPEMLDGRESDMVFLKPLITSPKIEVGDFTYYNAYNQAENPTLFQAQNVLYTGGPEKLVIGKFCAISTGAKFLLSPANPPTKGNAAFPFFIFGGTWLDRTAKFLPQVPSRGNIVIGNDVQIGRDAMIMPGVHIGDGAIVDSGAVVVSDIPPYTVASGNPAALVERRFSDEEVEILQHIAWWNWPIDAITEHVHEISAGTPAELEQVARKAGLIV